MDYAHARHAGNAGDVLKHIALIAALQELLKDPAPLQYVETHAGDGYYPLGSNGEWSDGAARFFALGPGGSGPDGPIHSGPRGPESWGAGPGLAGSGLRGPESPGPLAAYVSLLRSCSRPGALRPEALPGSPLIAASLLRPSDPAPILYELDPRAAAVLRNRFAGPTSPAASRPSGEPSSGAALTPNAQPQSGHAANAQPQAAHAANAHQQDGHAANARSLAGHAVSAQPAAARSAEIRESDGLAAAGLPARSLVLIDPPYTQKQEWTDTARSMARLYEEGAALLVWYPIKALTRPRALLAELVRLNVRGVAAEVHFTPLRLKREKLNGAGLIFCNASRTALPAFLATMPAVGETLQTHGEWTAIQIGF